MMLVWFPCLAQSGKVFREVNGLVSMEAENSSYVNLWRKVKGTSGAAMEAQKEGAWNGGVLRFDIEFAQQGFYAVWVLARKGTHSEYGANDVKVWLDRDLSGTPNPGIQNLRDDRLQTLLDGTGKPTFTNKKPESEIGFGQNAQFTWITRPKEADAPSIWKVETPGRHHIEFVVGDEYGYAIDKVVLTLDNKQRPSDSGPPETFP